MKPYLPEVKPAWRTPAVLSLCTAMREQQDFSAAPILADALQDAGCGDGALLGLLRHGPRGYASDCTLVACVLGEETAAAAEWLMDFSRNHSAPDYVTLVNAAAGHHDENRDADQPSYVYTEGDGEYLHFNGTDAHGEIPDQFWDRPGPDRQDDPRAAVVVFLLLLTPHRTLARARNSATARARAAGGSSPSGSSPIATLQVITHPPPSYMAGSTHSPHPTAHRLSRSRVSRSS
jgi:hypothetical protein